jgi:hypothetical protein
MHIRSSQAKAPGRGLKNFKLCPTDLRSPKSNVGAYAVILGRIEDAIYQIILKAAACCWNPILFQRFGTQYPIRRRSFRFFACFLKHVIHLSTTSPRELPASP